MPNPTPSSVHVDSLLTDLSIAFMQERSHFVADRVFPRVPVNKQSDKYATYSRADFNRDEAAVRAPGTESKGGGFTYNTDNNYFCDVIAFHQDVDYQTAANQDVGDSYDDALDFCTHKMLIRKEKSFVSSFMAASKWGTTITGSADGSGSNETIYWDDVDATPIDDIDSAKLEVLKATGFEPNKLVLSPYAFKALKNHPDVLERVVYTGSNSVPAKVTTSALAELFDLDEVLIAKGIVNDAAEGATEDSKFIVENCALLVYAAPRPGLKRPSGGYTFSWRGYPASQGLTPNEFGAVISRIPMAHLKAERVEMEMAYDQKMISAELGYFWNGIVENDG